MEPYIIAASILSADFTRLGEQIAEAETAGVDWVHVDVMDWHFVPNLTMGPFIVEACRRATNMPLNVHLMVDQPETMLEAFVKAGATHLIVHVETCPQIDRTLKTIKSLGCQAGVTLNPATPGLHPGTGLLPGRPGPGHDRSSRAIPGRNSSRKCCQRSPRSAAGWMSSVLRPAWKWMAAFLPTPSSKSGMPEQIRS